MNTLPQLGSWVRYENRDYRVLGYAAIEDAGGIPFVEIAWDDFMLSPTGYLAVATADLTDSDPYWKEQYFQLRSKRIGLNRSMVFDQVSAFGLVFRVSSDTVVIFINPALSWKEKVMTLAHEYGHVAKWNPEVGLVENTDRCYGEDEANLTAKAILRDFGVSEEEYEAFYQKGADFRKACKEGEEHGKV